MATLRVEIVTPEAALWQGEADALFARSSEGDFAVLPQHTDTVGDVVPSVVRVKTGGGELAFVVHGGFFQVHPDGEGVTLATLLAGVAERADELDVARAQAAKERAEAELAAQDRGEGGDAASRALAQAALERAELRLRAGGA